MFAGWIPNDGFKVLSYQRRLQAAASTLRKSAAGSCDFGGGMNHNDMDDADGNAELDETLTRLPGEEEPHGEPVEDDDSTRLVQGLFCPMCGGRYPGGITSCSDDGGVLLPLGSGDDLSGTVLRGRYVLIERIGQGGFGQVYRATHKLARAEVAVKVIRDEMRENAKARRQFLKEARALMRMQSRHAVAVHDVDEDEAGRMFVVMELLRGQNLEEHMKVVAPETRRLGWDETARIVIQMCDALEDAHDQGVVHRDLKPANVMMVEGRGGKLQARVVDFGIASLAQAGDSDLTSMDAIPKVIGTPAFMSPEQARGLSVTHKSDLYSLGAMMYRMVCGCKPFEAKTAQAILLAHVMEEPPSMRLKFPELDIPPEFDRLVMRMMAKKPEDRPTDAAEVAEALKAMLPGENASGGSRARGGFKLWPLVIGLGLLLVGGGVAAFFLLDRGDAPVVLELTSDGGSVVGANENSPLSPGSGSVVGATANSPLSPVSGSAVGANANSPLSPVSGSAVGANANSPSSPVSGSVVGATANSPSSPVSGSSVGATANSPLSPVSGSAVGATANSPSSPVSGSVVGATANSPSSPVSGSVVGANANSPLSPVSGSAVGANDNSPLVKKASPTPAPAAATPTAQPTAAPVPQIQAQQATVEDSIELQKVGMPGGSTAKKPTSATKDPDEEDTPVVEDPRKRKVMDKADSAFDELGF